MTNNQLTKQELSALREEAHSRILLMSKSPPVSEEKANQLLNELPEKIEGENLCDRIRRSSGHSNISQLPTKKNKQRFIPLTEITRLAADTSDQEFPLPDPGRALETPDGRFRFYVTSENNKIRIDIQALGFSADEYANCSIALLSEKDATDAFAIVKLGQDGGGSCLISNTKLQRKALLRPFIALVND